MAKKRFRSSMSGFNKKDVNRYIESLMDEYEEKLIQKDNSINDLNDQIEEYKNNQASLEAKEAELMVETENVAKALLKANEMSEQIIKEAKEAAFNEVTDLEIRAEQEREKIIDLKKELAQLQKVSIEMLESFSKSLEELTGRPQEEN